MKFRVGDKCPNCQVGKLVLRSGRFGDFLGCDMYRHTDCNFVGKIDPADQKGDLERQADEILRSHNKEYLILK